jgi:hypothetical protein
MKDRIPTYPGRVKLVPLSGNYYDMSMADEPTEAGTALNKALFDHVIAAVGTTAGTATALTLAGDGGFSLADGATIRFKLHVQSGASPTINVNGTGAKPLRSANGVAMQVTPAGAWVVATYSSTLDFFVLASSQRNPSYTPKLLDALLGYSPLYQVLEVTE